MLGSLAEKAGDEASPLLIPREEAKKIHIVLCTSDRGLCGGFQREPHYTGQRIHAGKRDGRCQFFLYQFRQEGARLVPQQRYLERVSEHLGVVGSKIGFNVASTEGRKLVDAFLDDTYDEVYVIYSEFISMGRQVPVTKQLLPIPPIEAEDVEVDEDTTYLAEHISVNPHPRSCWVIYCPGTYMFNCSAVCLRRPRANMPRAWRPWTTPPKHVTICSKT